jgi:hypothetical protein
MDEKVILHKKMDEKVILRKMSVLQFYFGLQNYNLDDSVALDTIK